MGGAGTSPPPRRPAATRGAVGARGAYVTCQVSIQVCFEIYSRFETQMFVSSGEVRDLILESLFLAPAGTQDRWAEAFFRARRARRGGGRARGADWRVRVCDCDKCDCDTGPMGLYY